jgi:hypothetical protein
MIEIEMMMVVYKLINDVIVVWINNVEDDVHIASFEDLQKKANIY